MPLVADVIARLHAVGALQYSPSLSSRVHDALFSYWRLPRPIQQSIRDALPVFSVDSGHRNAVTLDWGSVETCANELQDTHGVTAMELTCALALQAEQVLEMHVLPLIQRAHTASPLSTDEIVTHHSILRDLVALQDRKHGDYYMSFLVLVTVLERALYDIYHKHRQATSSQSRTKKKVMILRDLLHSSSLNDALPSGFMRLLRVLFLPSGLNLRNLVWHGFLIPAEFPRCFSSLTTMLVLALPTYCPQSKTACSSQSQPLFHPSWFDDKMTGLYSLRTINESIDLDRSLLEHVATVSRASPFVPRGRQGLVQSALQALAHGNEYWFYFALLPVLEHALRVEFVRLNGAAWGTSSRYCQAQIDEYYSTLDGFGQRDKHQVLLHALVRAANTDSQGIGDGDGDGDGDPSSSVSEQMNALYLHIPVSALAVCLDLFMMAAGPNIRGKLCHGEADLTGFRVPVTNAPCPSATQPGKASSIAQLLLLAWSSMVEARGCRESHESHSIVQAFKASVGSSFHPFFQLQRSLKESHDRLQSFSSLHTRWWAAMTVESARGDPSPASEVSIVRFTDVMTAENNLISIEIHEKTVRMSEFQELAARVRQEPTIAEDEDGNGSKSNKKKSNSFGHQLAVLYDITLDVQARLDQHVADSHSTRHVDARIVPPRTEPPHQRQLSEHDAESRWMERFQLALSDTDGLSVSACMMEILACIQRSFTTTEIRFSTLVAIIQGGRARTNHRRSFLALIHFLPVFEAVQAVCLQLVGHQLAHIAALAQLKAVALTTSSCTLAPLFEQLQSKLLQFITAFEGCTGSTEASQKSADKAVQLACQFFRSKAVRAVLPPRVHTTKATERDN